MYSLYYKGLRLGVTFQVKPLCVGDFASFAKIFAGFYFGRGIVKSIRRENAIATVALKKARREREL
jgi:hypothetical protein